MHCIPREHHHATTGWPGSYSRNATTSPRHVIAPGYDYVFAAQVAQVTGQANLLLLN